MELKNCQKAEIYDQKGTLLCEAEVTKASFDHYRLIVPLTFDFDETVDVYPVIFYDAVAGLIHTECKLSDPLNLTKDQQSLLCAVRVETGKEQRRQDLKVPAEVPIDISCTRVPPGQKRPAGRIPALTRNISAGGIYFFCDQSIPVGAQIQFQLHEAAKPLQLTARVLRREEFQPDQESRGRFGHGCRFLDMRPQTEAELRSYIFRKEAELRRRMRDR